MSMRPMAQVFPSVIGSSPNARRLWKGIAVVKTALTSEVLCHISTPKRYRSHNEAITAMLDICDNLNIEIQHVITG